MAVPIAPSRCRILTGRDSAVSLFGRTFESGPPFIELIKLPCSIVVSDDLVFLIALEIRAGEVTRTCVITEELSTSFRVVPGLGAVDGRRAIVLTGSVLFQEILQPEILVVQSQKTAEVCGSFEHFTVVTSVLVIFDRHPETILATVLQCLIPIGLEFVDIHAIRACATVTFDVVIKLIAFFFALFGVIREASALIHESVELFTVLLASVDTRTAGAIINIQPASLSTIQVRQGSGPDHVSIALLQKPAAFRSRIDHRATPLVVDTHDGTAFGLGHFVDAVGIAEPDARSG